MKQVLVQLDDRLAAELEKIAPGRSHKRSAFVRKALVRALNEEIERQTRAAYERWPDEDVPVLAGAWAPEAEAIHPEESASVGASPEPARARTSRATRPGPKRKVAGASVPKVPAKNVRARRSEAGDRR